MALVTFLLPVAFLWTLSRPSPVPEQIIPEPNGYDAIRETASAIAISQFEKIELDWETVSSQKLHAALSDTRSELAELHAVLKLDCSARIDYSSDILPMEDMINFRTLARALAADARLAQIDGRPDDAARIYLDAIQLGYRVRAGGLLIDGLVGIGCSWTGAQQLYRIRESLSSEACHEAIDQIMTMTESAETYGAFHRRDRIWEQNALGWHGHLQMRLFDLTGSTLLFSNEEIRDRFVNEQATMRLLITELGLRAYYLDHQAWPDSLDALSPDYLDRVPADPFDDHGGLLRYKPMEDGYEMYSLGVNRIDDGGERLADDNSFFFKLPTAGDLRLDVQFSQDDEGTSDDRGTKNGQ